MFIDRKFFLHRDQILRSQIKKTLLLDKPIKKKKKHK